MTLLRWTIIGTLLAGLAAPAASEELDGRELLRRIDDMWRGTSSAARISMRVKTEHWDRTLEMKAYSKGTELTLVRITEPKQEAGTATLKVDENMWNYLPKTRRVMKIPSSMMMGSWMGSHFTNDDLVKESRLEEDYEFELQEQDGTYLLTLNPKPEAPVVWGRIELEVEKERLVPVLQKYFDEQGELVRQAEYGRVQTIGERTLSTSIKMVPLDKPGEFTEVIYEEILFDVPLEESFFSIQNLKRR